MKVGINASFLRKRATGIGQVTWHFLETLSRVSEEMSAVRKKPVEFILYLEEPLPEEICLSSQFSVRVGLPFFWRRDDLIRKAWWETVWLPRRASADGCDVFLSLYQSSTVMPKKMRHLMLAHDIIPKLFPEYLNNIRKKVFQKRIDRGLKNADELIVVSKRTEKDIIAHLGISAKKISVHPIDVDPDFKREVSSKESVEVMRRYNLSPGYVYCGGGLEKRKNVEGVLFAYAALVKKEKSGQFPCYLPPLVLSGKLMPQLAPLVTDVELLVKRLNLSSRVRILGFVPQKDVPVLCAHASIFVFPSLYEGFGLPVLEAMSQGTAVLTSQTASLPEVGGDAVAYCNPESVQSIASKMEQLLAGPSMRLLLGARGKERSRIFSWENFTVAMIRKILV